MSLRIRVVVLTLISSSIVLGTGRYSGEKGVRAHRTRLAAGGFFACAIADDGTVHCWGNNPVGQLGDGTLISRTSPVAVVNLGAAVSIAAGASTACAILSASGAVRCWGSNIQGQLGNGTVTNSATPVAVISLANMTSLAVGADHACAVRVDGSVWCW